MKKTKNETGGVVSLPGLALVTGTYFASAPLQESMAVSVLVSLNSIVRMDLSEIEAVGIENSFSMVASVATEMD